MFWAVPVAFLRLRVCVTLRGTRKGLRTAQDRAYAALIGINATEPQGSSFKRRECFRIRRHDQRQRPARERARMSQKKPSSGTGEGEECRWVPRMLRTTLATGAVRIRAVSQLVSVIMGGLYPAQIV